MNKHEAILFHILKEYLMCHSGGVTSITLSMRIHDKHIKEFNLAGVYHALDIDFLLLKDSKNKYVYSTGSNLFRRKWYPAKLCSHLSCAIRRVHEI